MSIPHHEAADKPVGSPSRPPLVMVYVGPDRYAASELIAGASLSQELGGRCYAVCERRTSQEYAASHSIGRGATRLNEQLAEMLGAVVVNIAVDDAADGAIDFAKREGVSHVVLSTHAAAHLDVSPGSILQRLANGLRGVEVRVVPAGPRTTWPGWSPWTPIASVLPAVFLCAVLVLATAAIVYLPWPIMFGLTAIAAAVWCWLLERRRELPLNYAESHLPS